ncbi:hypothetical protein [Faecalimicrobium sp. JNUCC 81]
MKFFVCGIFTILIGYILSNLFSGVGTSIAEMTYVNACTNAVLFLSGIISFWGYLILDSIKKK